MAWIYAISVWATYAIMHECHWHDKLYGIAIRLAIVMDAIACSIGLCARTPQRNPDWHIAVPVSLLFLGLALYCIVQTRRIDVVGSEPPKYGKDSSTWMKDKVVVITGANSGIGKETAQQLAGMGATVILACRSQARAEQAMAEIRQSSSNITEKQLVFLECDLGNLASVRKAAQILAEKKITINVLINNAGVMMAKKTITKDGFELTMQANHLGHFLLTVLLLPLFADEDVRVLSLTSSTYEMASKGFDFEDMFCDKSRSYTLFGQYAMSKLANILFVKELNQRYGKRLKAFAVHPGIVRTEVVRNMPWYLRYHNRIFAYGVAACQKTPQQGAYCSVHCAASPTPPASGSYVVDCREYPELPCASSVEDAKRLWEVSAALLKWKD